MSECKEQVCCETSPFDGQCCQPTPFDYQAPVYRNTEQCYTATCPSGQVGEPSRVCVPEGSYTSTISQAAADALALAAATSAANEALVCTCGGLALPTISPATGTEITLPCTITLTHSNPSAQIYYSINSGTGPFVLYTGPFTLFGLVGGQPAVTAYVVLTSCSGEQAYAEYTVNEGCQSFTVNQRITLDTVCGDGFVEECGGYANWSINFTSDTFKHQNLLGAFNLYAHFPYVQMWDGICPLGCRGNPREHTSGGMLIGPYAVDVEIFAITPLWFDDIYTFDSETPPSTCSCSLGNECPAGVIKTLAAGATTTLKVWDTFGAHCWALGWLGVREAGTISDCSTDSPAACGCGSSTNTGSIESLMRAIQERYRVGQNLPLNSGGGLFITWPDNDASASPGNYPANGFYASDSTPNRVQHVKDARAGISTIVDMDAYTAANSLENIEVVFPDVTPFYTNETLGLPEDAEITSVAVGLSLLRPCVCALTNILINASGTGSVPDLQNVVQKVGAATEGGDCGISTASLEISWAAATPMAQTSLPFISVGISSTDSGADIQYGSLAWDLTNYGVGSALAYAALGFLNVPPPGYLQYAPHSNTDNLLHQFQTVTTGAPYTSAPYGYNVALALAGLPIIGGCPSYYGWQMTSFKLLVTKSNVPADANWNYYP